MIDQRTNAPIAYDGPTPIRIGYCLSLTGPLADNSRSARLAHDIWRQDVNTRGGVLGRPIELICYDDHGDASLVPGIPPARPMSADQMSASSWILV